MSKNIKKEDFSPFKEKMHELIFEADTPHGKTFDIALIIAILASVLVVMLESVESYDAKYHQIFDILEWILTAFFTIEYILRLYIVYRPMKYALSFFGLVDLLSILPSYLSFFIAGSESLMVIRILRLLRVFRIFKLAKFTREGQIIMIAMKKSYKKILVFLTFILLLVTIFGSIMYIIEVDHPDTGFDSIPRSIYWAIVTLTTVGYGDIAPHTPLGQFLAAIVMMLGYAVIAVPTGIVTAELTNTKEQHNTQACRFCAVEGHDDEAEYCYMCGEELNVHHDEDDKA